MSFTCFTTPSGRLLVGDDLRLEGFHFGDDRGVGQELGLGLGGVEVVDVEGKGSEGHSDLLGQDDRVPGVVVLRGRVAIAEQDDEDRLAADDVDW